MTKSTKASTSNRGCTTKKPRRSKLYQRSNLARINLKLGTTALTRNLITILTVYTSVSFAYRFTSAIKSCSTMSRCAG
jgi:hypothetical protein